MMANGWITVNGLKLNLTGGALHFERAENITTPPVDFATLTLPVTLTWTGKDARKVAQAALGMERWQRWMEEYGLYCYLIGFSGEGE